MISNYKEDEVVLVAVCLVLAFLDSVLVIRNSVCLFRCHTLPSVRLVVSAEQRRRKNRHFFFLSEFVVRNCPSFCSNEGLTP